jgi:diguanylate cyclase (GGDEF)-like protein
MLRLVQREGDRNPTSGLPGGRAIEGEIMARLEAGALFSVCYLDLDNFKPFADTFGFAIADVVIRGLGAAIRGASSAVPGDPAVDFVGHIGGDDFIVISSAERAAPLMDECAARCRQVIETAVGPAAAAQGTYSGVDREGRVRDFPLAGVSVAVLHVQPASWVNMAHLGMRAAELKRRAKMKGHGAVLVETA